MNRPITDDETNSAARGCRMWSKTPEELDRLAESHDRLPLFASRVIAKAAREVAAAKRTIQAAHL